MKRLGDRLGKLERKEREGEEGRKTRGEKDNREMEDRMREIEGKLEKKEREGRRKNIIIKGLEERKGKRRKAVEEVLRKIGVEIEMGEIKRIGGDREKGREMVMVKLGNEEQKREVMGKKNRLKGRKEKILEDWTWKERRMRWRLEEIAKNEENKGKSLDRVW